MFCKPDMLERDRSPISVTEQYDKFICDETDGISTIAEHPVTVTGEKDDT